ncbi:APC family permease [Rhodococcus jostii]|uniref:Amino acid transporter n=1 Tax=Rhodococcus jostii TaxID=132919 RepID=A0A1H5CVF7_RHOJO|nr:APC family permease [Rhodococcus jostii]SED70510.1 Amino acid transporter [Rhodococcus jostii]
MKKSAPGTASGTQLEGGALGTSGIVFFVVAAAAPLLVMAGVAPLALDVSGIGAPGGYILAGLALGIFAVGFTAMSKYIHNAGAFYSYISIGLGPRWGLAAAVLALVSYNALEIGIFGALGYFAQSTAADLIGLDLPWGVWSLIGVVLIWILGSRSVHVGARFLILLLTAETGILVLLAVAVLLRGGAEGLGVESFAPSHVFSPGLGGVLTLAFAAFIGFEATALYREEAKDPSRTIPRATYTAVAFLGLFYAFMVWIIIQAYGPDHALALSASDPAGMYFGAIENYVGGWASTLMELLIVTSILASLLAFHNAITRYAFALSREHILPQVLGKLHPVYKSPYVASAVQSVLAMVVIVVFAIAGADPYLQLLLWVNSPGVVGIVVLQAMAAAAVLAFFWRDRRGHSVWRVVVAPAAALAMLIYATWLIVTQMDLLTAAGPAVNAVLVAVTPVSLAIGFTFGTRLARRDPARFARLGTTDVDAEPSLSPEEVSNGPIPPGKAT